ncbi:UMP-CMP kinase [Suillus paluster]|uniref:UMP-CMP kinase n=1 Tax=Suillus paluster TaxID=48578 RepID=UPI001B8742A8|nr:UMP-CMP kinase [Suillus paluster]KAG1723606.1 UMP-CMP kinase [Suillus paluster]
MAESKSSPVFDAQKVTVIYVLGGPGAGNVIGKGTQCSKLVDAFGFCHLSAGDLLREEQNRDGSQYGELIRTCIREGTIVPSHVTIKLLENAMTEEVKKRTGDGWTDGRGRFLIDGFPRKLDQAVGFDETVCLASLVIFFDTTEDVMLERLLERAKTSGREDDNVETIRKRFRTYNEQTMPVIEYYKTLDKVAEIDSTVSVEQVYRVASATVSKLFS